MQLHPKSGLISKILLLPILSEKNIHGIIEEQGTILCSFKKYFSKEGEVFR